MTRNTSACKRIFFSHIPKNGGMLIRYFLRNQFAKSHVCNFTTWEEYLTANSDDLADFRLFQGHFQCDAARLLPPSDLISFFRNPVERTLSLMLHLRRDPSFHLLHSHAKNKSISEMLDDEVITSNLANHQTSYLSGMIDFVNMRESFSDRNMSVDVADYMTPPDLKIALSRLSSLAFVGLTEHLDESLNHLCERYNFHPCFEYPLRNHASGGEKNLISTLADNDIKRIKALNDLDLPLYECAQELFNSLWKPAPYTTLARKSLEAKTGASMLLNSLNQIDLSEPLFGTNWYEPDEEDGIVYRWSGPSPLSSIEWPLAVAKPRKVRIELFPFPGDNLAGSLEVQMDKQACAPAKVLPSGRIIYEILIAPNSVSKTNGFHQMLFTHSTDISKRPTNDDQRILRFGLTSICVNEINDIEEIGVHLNNHIDDSAERQEEGSSHLHEQRPAPASDLNEQLGMLQRTVPEQAATIPKSKTAPNMPSSETSTLCNSADSPSLERSFSNRPATLYPEIQAQFERTIRLKEDLALMLVEKQRLISELRQKSEDRRK